MKRNNALKMNKNKYQFFKGTNQIDIHLAKLIKKKNEQTLGIEKEYGLTRASPVVRQ